MKSKELTFLFIVLVLSSIAFSACQSESKTKEGFVLYDAMLFKNKPNLETDGLKPIVLLYEHRLTMKDDSGKVVLDYEKIRREAKKAAKRPEVVVSTDIEKWYSDSSVSDEEMKSRFNELFDIFREENPNVTIGNYGIAPSSLNIYRFYDRKRKEDSDETENSKLIEQWRKNNERRFVVMPLVDMITPCLYTPEPNIKAWEEDFKTTIEEIRKHDKEKPIVVYLWPAYYDAPWSEYNRLIIEADLWKEILEITYKYADSAIIWSGSVDKDRNPVYWNDPKVQEVWKITKKFIEDKGLN